MPSLTILVLLMTLPWLQEQNPPSASPTVAAQPPVTSPPRLPRPPTPVLPSRFTPFAVAFTGFDSNINHDTSDIDSFGAVLGVGGLYRNNPQKPTLELQYQAGLHRYTGTTAWDRLSHYARAAWDRRLSKRWALETVGEASIKGSTEDRELSNQLLLSPRLEFRFSSAWRLRGFGAWRVKRYEDSPDRNAFNRYAGLELVARPHSGIRWEAGGRYELNAAESARQTYRRWTWYGGLDSPVTRHDRISFDLHYRRQRYPYRLVDVRGGPDVPRRDWRLDPGIGWLHTIDDDVDVRIDYGFSGRDSNDPRRDYRSHQVTFSVLQRW